MNSKPRRPIAIIIVQLLTLALLVTGYVASPLTGSSAKADGSVIGTWQGSMTNNGGDPFRITLTVNDAFDGTLTLFAPSGYQITSTDVYGTFVDSGFNFAAQSGDLEYCTFSANVSSGATNGGTSSCPDYRNENIRATGSFNLQQQ